MHIRKFESETLEAAFKDIKRELGPDAIILKTVTKRGLKNAFRKTRVEVTAAISEKNYLKKAKVDEVLTEEDKSSLYMNRANHISNMLDNYSSSSDGKKAQVVSQGYGKIGINQSVKKIGNKVKSGLDEFLNNFPIQKNKTELSLQSSSYEVDKKEDESLDRVGVIEKRVCNIEKKIEEMGNEDVSHLSELKTMLRSLEIGEKHIQDIMKKIINLLPKEDLNDAEAIYELTLREMLLKVKTEMPLFSRCDMGNRPTVTILISRSQCGQSSMAFKLSALKDESVVLQNCDSCNLGLARKLYNIETANISSLPKIIDTTKKFQKDGRDIFIDYKDIGKEVSEIRRNIDGLKKSLDNVEILVCISSIHSGVYNRSILSKYNRIADGIVATNIDLCLDYGQLFNIACDFNGLPFKFFGTGNVIPDDVESATGERIIAGLFQLGY